MQEEMEPVLDRVDLSGSGNIVHVCNLSLVTILSQISFIRKREDMRSLEKRPLASFYMHVGERNS